MSFWWEHNLTGLDEETAKERRRVLEIIEAHRDTLETLKLYRRLASLISQGADLHKESLRHPEDQTPGLQYPENGAN